MNLFKNGPTTNLLPFGVAYDKASNASVIFDRLFRPIVECPGKWPKCDLALAVPCDRDAPRLYGVKAIATFFGEHSQPQCDPPVRARIRALVAGCAALSAELRQRALIQSHEDAAPTAAREHASLIAKTFSEVAA
jgi:hypothetical protein